MRSNKIILVMAMVCYVCEGEAEFHDICDILKTETEHEILTLIFLEKLVCSKDLAVQLLTRAQLMLAEMYLERLKLSISGVDIPHRAAASEVLSYGKRHDWLNCLPPFNNTNDVIPSTVLDELTLLQTLLCNSMSHKELIIYVNEYIVKNNEVLKPIALSLQALCWPHMDKLDEAMDALLSSCPDPIIEYSITIFGQELNQWTMLLNKLLQLVSQQVADKRLTKIYPALYKRALFYVVEITSPDEFFKLLPARGSMNFFLPVIERCCQLYAAKQLGDEIRSAILS